MSIESIHSHCPVGVSEVITNEKVLFNCANYCFAELKTNIKVPNLTAKLTTHRLVLHHPTHQNFNFEWHYSQISNYSIEKRGWFSKIVYELKLTMTSGHSYKIKKMDRSEIEDFTSVFNKAYNSDQWRYVAHQSEIVKPSEDFGRHNQQHKTQSDVMPGHNEGKKGGIVMSRDILAAERQEMAHQQDMVMSSFDNLNGLMKNIDNLKDVLSFIKNAGLSRDQDFQNSHQKSEADDILADLGVVDITTKSESGNNFYVKTAQTISDLFSKILPKMKNIMSQIDVYLYYNRLAGLNLITPDDQVQACRLFAQIKSPQELRELESGTKVIMFKNHDPKEDFKKNLYPYLDNENGLSAEVLAKKSDVSLIVAKIRLQDCQKLGALVVDNSMEGIRYFQNDIITVKVH